MPTAFPFVLREAGAGLAFALKLVVSAEVVTGTYKCLGKMMQSAQVDKEMATLFALVIIVFLCGMVLEGGVALASRMWEKKWK